MAAKNETAVVNRLEPAEHATLALNEAAIDASRRNLSQGAMTPHYGPWKKDVIQLLNDSLATELVCVLRYRRHYFMAEGLLAEAIKTVVAPTLKLTAEQQTTIAPHARIERYGKGELILLSGVIPAGMSFVMSGTVLLAADAEDGSRLEVGRIEPGGFLGQSTLIRQPVSGSTYALDEVTLVHVEREAIERVVQKSPALLYEFGRSIDERRASVLRALGNASTVAHSDDDVSPTRGSSPADQ